MAKDVNININSNESSLNSEESEKLRMQRERHAAMQRKRERIEREAERNAEIRDAKERDRVEDRRMRRSRAFAAEQRAERAEIRSEASHRRQEARERDRILDRERRAAEREERRQERRERAANRHREQRRRQAEREYRDALTHENRIQVHRRRFINDLLGAVNQAHMGRRINHAIDFMRALTGRGGQERSTPAPLGSGPSQIINQGGGNTAHTVSNFTNAASNSQTWIRNIINRRQGVGRESAGTPVEPTPQAGGAGGGGRPPLPTLPPSQSLLNRARGAPPPSPGVPTARMISPFPSSGGMGAMAVAGPIGAIAAAVVIGATGLTVAFRMLDGSVRRFADTLDGFPGDLLFARVERDLTIFARNLQRASEFGSELGSIERLRTRRMVVGMNIADAWQRAILPLTESMNRTLTQLYELIGPFIEIFFSDFVAPLFDQFGKAFERLGYMLNGIEVVANWLIEWMQPFAELVPFIGVLVDLLTRWFSDDDRDGSEYMKEVYTFLNQNNRGGLNAYFNKAFKNQATFDIVQPGMQGMPGPFGFGPMAGKRFQRGNF